MYRLLSYAFRFQEYVNNICNSKEMYYGEIIKDKKITTNLKNIVKAVNPLFTTTTGCTKTSNRGLHRNEKATYVLQRVFHPNCAL